MPCVALPMQSPFELHAWSSRRAVMDTGLWGEQSPRPGREPRQTLRGKGE
jgi:hypothetical protein